MLLDKVLVKLSPYIGDIESFRRYFSNTSWILAEQVLRMFSGLFVGVWLARYLGPSQFGTLSYALAFVSILGVIAKLGLDGIAVRDMVKNETSIGQYMGTIFWLKLVGASITICLILLIASIGNQDQATFLYISIIAAGLFFQPFEVVDFYLQSKVLSKFVSISKLVQLVLSSLVKLYLIITQAELIYFVAVSLFDQITLSTTLYFTYRRLKKPKFLGSFDGAVAKTVLRQSWIVIFTSLLNLIYLRIDQIMIKEMLGDSAVGVYAAASKFSETIYIIPMVIISSIFPAIVMAKSKGVQIYAQRLQQIFSAMIWLALLLSIPGLIFSKQIVLLLYGDAYNQTGDIFFIQSCANVFVFLGIASGKWYLNESLFKLAFLRTFSGCSVNIILNVILIRQLGLPGAALSLVATHIVNGLLFDLFSIKTRQLFYMKVRATFFLPTNFTK